MPDSHRISFFGEELELRADRTLWWPRLEILFLADIHVGKTRHMVRAGIPIPTGSLEADLERLSAAVNELSPKRVIVLGDLFHSVVNTEWDQLVAWVATLPCTFELVRGNHDRFMKDSVLESGGITVHPEGYILETFALWHHPQSVSELPVLCGHVHPVYQFRGPARDVMRLPVFMIEGHQITLPAYGSFTGGFDIAKEQFIKLIGCGPDYKSLVSKTKS